MGITSFLKCPSSLVVKVHDPALSSRCPSQPQGFCSMHGEMLLHQRYCHVLSEQHGVEKQVLISTPRGEARTQVGHACWTGAQTPGTWCLPRHAHTHTHTEPLTGSLPDFLALSRLIPAGLSCAFIFPEPRNSAKDELGHPNPHSSCQAEQRPCWRINWCPWGAEEAGSSSSDGSRTWGLPKVPALGGHASGCPGKVGLGRSFASAVQLHSGPMRSPSLGHMPEPHKNCRYLMRVRQPPCSDDHVTLTSV